MAQAGANIQAFLKLDATGFIEGVTASKEAVAQLKESMKNVKVSEFSKSSNALNKFAQSMKEIGLNSGAITTGLRNISDALVLLIPQLSQFTTLAKESTTFQKFALGLQNIATAAQRLGTDIERGSIGMNALTEVMNIWRAGVDSAEIKVTGLATAMRELVSSSTGTSSNLASQDTTVKNLRNSYGESLNTLREFANAMNSENRALLMNTQAMVQYEAGATNLVQVHHMMGTTIQVLNTSTQQYNTSLNTVNATTQRWKSLTDSTINSTSNLSNSLKTTNIEVSNLGNRLNTTSGAITKMISPINNVSGEFARLKAEMGAVSESYRVLKFDAEGNNVTLEKSSVALQKNSQEMLKNAEAKLRALGYTGQVTTAEERLANAEAQVNSYTQQASASLDRYSSSSARATAQTNAQTNATNKLKSAMSSLKMVGSLVASMMVWNFASSLINATRETVNAKSEMEGYFKMLHFSQGEIADFNNALDETVGKFQRINKYSLGETISSIGVEFNLTTEEMKKAMPVVSMITSEYLRAGRNANEASLAVKDILQGEFQRLSRETGVKGDQLKEAGWSGDKKDVMGLLEALDTVGKSRNWDVFVTKANSLNDAVLILQNRFGEWTADMVNYVQPSILAVFNTLMALGQAVSPVIEGIWSWLNSDGIAQSVIKWTGLATAVGIATTSLIHYRTGATLAQMVQMGLRGSIMATILQLNAEIVAEKGVRTAIISKITALNMEMASTMSLRQAIATKILGLNAELVAQKGVRGAIMASTFAEQLATASKEGANAEELKAIALHQQEQLSRMGSVRAIAAHILGLNMETFAERGFIVALAQRIGMSPLYIGSLKAEEIAELSTAEASLLLAGTLAPLVAIFIALAVAVYSVVKPLQDASEQMKSFNNLVNNGDEIIKSHKKSVDSLTNSEKALTEELAKQEKNSDKYLQIQERLKQVTEDKKYANDLYTASIEAVQKARSSQAKFDETKDEIALHNQAELIRTYEKLGITRKKATEMASEELASQRAGTEQLTKALQMLRLESDKGIEKRKKTINMLDQYGLSDEELMKYGDRLTLANKKIRDGLEKFMTSDDLMERIGGWFEIQQGRLEQWWTEFEALFTVRDWQGMGEKLYEGLKYILDLNPINKFFDDLSKTIADKGIINTIMDALFGEGDSDGALDIIWDFLNKCILTPIADWITWFMQDPISHFDKITGEFSLALAKALFGKNQSDDMRTVVEEWFNTTVVPAITDYFSADNFLKSNFSFGGIGIFSLLPKVLFGDDADWYGVLNNIPDPVGAFGEWFGTKLSEITMDLDTRIRECLTNIISYDYIGEFLSYWGLNFDWNAKITEMLSGISNFDMLGWLQTNVITPFSTNLYNGIMSIPLLGDIIQLLATITGANPDAQNKGSQLARAFGNAVETIVGNIPILGDVLRFLGVIPQANPTAKSNGKGVGDSVKQGVKNGINGLADLVKEEIDRIKNYLENKAKDIYNSAKNYGSNLLQGFRDAMDMNSPSIISKELLPDEFGVRIPQVLSDSSAVAYSSAQGYGQAIVDGISSVNNDFSLGGVADEYQSDAQTIATYSQMMGTDTTMAFNDMTLAVNGATTQMSTNVASTYSQIQTRQATMLNSMKSSNLTAYQQMNTQSNQSLLQMRDSTSNVTNQMVHAWAGMKDSIVATANSLRSETTAHFNTLSSNIGSFYRKIQNPSSWGSAGSPNITKAPTVRRGSTFAGGTNSRYSPYSRSGATMSLNRLKQMICPSGDCNLFDGYDLSQVVNVADFLSTFQGDIGFGWNGWNGRHYQYIRSRSNEWSMKSPVLNVKGGIPTNANFKVGEFETGQPKISFGAFQSMAESLFSAVPYAFYYNSDKYGSWQNALANGECNCWDGANALIAFARTCGFDGSIAHGSWDGIPHVWAVINGRKMDTTGWQQRGTWTPSASAGSPPNGFGNNYNGNVTVNINVYGDDVEVDENAVDLSTAQTIIDLVGINPSTGV